MIYETLAKINEEIKAIGKTETNQTLKFKFRGIDQVLNELHTLFAKHGVTIESDIDDIKTETWEQVTEYQNGGSKTTRWNHVHLLVTYYFVDRDGDRTRGHQVPGEAMDNTDKAINKAMSIAMKCMLIQKFSIPTDEKKDPDYDAPGIDPEPKQQQVDPQKALAENARRQAEAAKTVDELKAVYELFPSLKTNKSWNKLVGDLKLKLVSTNNK